MLLARPADKKNLTNRETAKTIPQRSSFHCGKKAASRSYLNVREVRRDGSLTALSRICCACTSSYETSKHSVRINETCCVESREKNLQRKSRPRTFSLFYRSLSLFLGAPPKNSAARKCSSIQWWCSSYRENASQFLRLTDVNIYSLSWRSGN